MSGQVFHFGNQQVRVCDIDGEPWFVGVDVIRCIGLQSSATNYLTYLNKDEKQTITRAFALTANLITSDYHGGQKFTLISESGLYKLIMRSDKPAAKQFQDWVTREALLDNVIN